MYSYVILQWIPENATTLFNKWNFFKTLILWSVKILLLNFKCYHFYLYSIIDSHFACAQEKKYS